MSSELEQRSFGRTGEKVSVIGLGGAALYKHSYGLGVAAVIPYGPSGIGSDPWGNWLRCLPDDLSIRSRGGP